MKSGGFTPSDAAHVLGLQDNWPGPAAELAAKLMVRFRDMKLGDAERVDRHGIAEELQLIGGGESNIQIGVASQDLAKLFQGFGGLLASPGTAGGDTNLGVAMFRGPAEALERRFGREFRQREDRVRQQYRTWFFVQNAQQDGCVLLLLCRRESRRGGAQGIQFRDLGVDGRTEFLVVCPLITENRIERREGGSRAARNQQASRQPSPAMQHSLANGAGNLEEACPNSPPPVETRPDETGREPVCRVEGWSPPRPDGVRPF